MTCRAWGALLVASTLCLPLACGEGEGSSGEALFGSDGFERALEAVRDEAGEDASLLRVQITDRGAEFHLLGDEPRGLIYTGEALQETEVVAAGGLAKSGFPLAEVDPEAVDRLLGGAEDQAGDDFDPVAITLERSTLDRQLRWTLNGQDGASFSAGADGSDPQGF